MCPIGVFSLVQPVLPVFSPMETVTSRQICVSGMSSTPAGSGRGGGQDLGWKVKTILTTRKTGANLPPLLGPGADHNMNKTGKHNHKVNYVTYFLKGYFLFASATHATGFQTTLTSPDMIFEEGLSRCFQFWYLYEVKT